MSTAVSMGIQPPAAHAIRQADDGIITWLSDLVTGSGSSPSHTIITGILGVVPGMGQAMDARDLVISVIAIPKSPAAIGGWVELSITFVGCVPAVTAPSVAGRSEVKQIIAELKIIQRSAPKMIDVAFDELKRLHSKTTNGTMTSTKKWPEEKTKLA